ncbi:MAG TPA: alpha-glucosidase C-terminal domain-containing protein, partial [Polyangiales bacterium]|nr:alpha-glucosidase C-terminal domain-containing protein [Polyangiales bacterium]
LREGHVDGYRLDAAWGIRARSPTFWPRFVDDVRRIRPGAPLIAEASILDDFYTQQGFDAAYDWTESLGHAAWEHVFDDKPGIARRLHAAVARTNEHTLRFLNNNDTGERFITRHGEALTRVATVALLTLPGIPCLYSFDEVGAEFKPYESLEPVHVRNDSLREFHQRWIWLRRTHPALSGSGFEVVDVGSRDELYAYLRSGGGRKVLVLLNFSRSPVTRDLPLPQSFTDLMSGETLASERGRLHVALGPWEARALEQR